MSDSTDDLMMHLIFQISTSGIGDLNIDLVKEKGGGTTNSCNSWKSCDLSHKALVQRGSQHTTKTAKWNQGQGDSCLHVFTEVLGDDASPLPLFLGYVITQGFH